MFGHYRGLGWRHLTRHRVYRLIDSVGLSHGMARCLPICVFIQSDLSYGRLTVDARRILRPRFASITRELRYEQSGV